MMVPPDISPSKNVLPSLSLMVGYHGQRRKMLPLKIRGSSMPATIGSGWLTTWLTGTTHKTTLGWHVLAGGPLFFFYDGMGRSLG